MRRARIVKPLAGPRARRLLAQPVGEWQSPAMEQRARQLAARGAWQAAQDIAKGELQAGDYLEAALTRIDEREAVVRAWVRRDDTASVARAAQLDGADAAAAPQGGPLRGLPIGVKDIIDTVAFPTEHGSPIYAGATPGADAWCVQQVLAAHGVVLGKTVTTEFAYFHPGPTTNPWNAGHTPGGSSSGSAAAVADGMVPLAFGSQTAGSIIRPASFCGVFGYKPTFGRYSLDGVKELSISNDTLGFFARKAADLQWFDAVLLDPSAAASADWRPREWRDAGDAHRDTPRIAVVRGPEWDKAGPECDEALARAVGAAEAAGAEVAAHEPPESFTAVGGAQLTVMQYEAAQALALDAGDPRLSDPLRKLLAAGAAVSDASYTAAREMVARCRGEQEQLFAGADIILTPSAPGAAPRGIGATGDPAFNRRWTALHMPCVSVPVHRSSSGLPVGVQVVARVGEDVAALSAALWIESILGLEWSPPDDSPMGA